MKASVVRCAGIESEERLESAAQTVSLRVPRLKSIRTVLVIFQELRTVCAASVSTLSLTGYRKLETFLSSAPFKANAGSYVASQETVCRVNRQS